MLIIEAAIAKLGEENQMRQTQEELAELIVAINKYERAIKAIKNDGHPSYIAYTRMADAEKEVIEEMADVLIMLDAVKKILDIQDEEIERFRTSKLNRLLDRLKKESEL